MTDDITKNNTEFNILVGQALNLAVQWEAKHKEANLEESVKKFVKLILDSRNNTEIKNIYTDYKYGKEPCSVCGGIVIEGDKTKVGDKCITCHNQQIFKMKEFRADTNK